MALWPKFEILTVLGAVFPHFCPYKREIWHGGAEVRSPMPNFTFIGATCRPCGAKNPFLDPWVKTIPVGRSPAGKNKKLSCRREAARCFVSVCSQLQHSYSAAFLILVTAASELLVHNILLNSVLLSSIVSGGVQPKTPGQTPLGHNPLCLLPFVGRLGSGPRLVGRIGSGVRVSVSFNKNTRRVLSYDVLRQQKTGVMTKGVVSWGEGLTSSPAYNVEPVSSTSSSSCANNGLRGKCSTLAAIHRGFLADR